MGAAWRLPTYPMMPHISELGSSRLRPPSAAAGAPGAAANRGSFATSLLAYHRAAHAHAATPVRASAVTSSDCARPPGRTSPAQAAFHAPTCDSGSRPRPRPRSPAGPSGTPGPRPRVALALQLPGARAPLEAFTGPDALQQARRSQPDAIILDTALPDGDASGLCRALRVDPDITASTPIFVTTAGPTTRQQVSDALRAGANSVWADPIDTEEFLLRLDGQLRTKFDADRAREEGLLDQQTGLYNTQGLERRARELASHVDRRGAALACVVLAPDATTEVDATIESLGRILRSVGRGSDTIGRVGRRELAVLAPYTDAPAALRLAPRLLETAAELAGGGALGIRAGHRVRCDFRTSLRDPAGLVSRGPSALGAPFADGGAERIRSS